MFTQVMNSSGIELKSQQVGGMLYLPVHLEPMALGVMWLKKVQCQNRPHRHYSKYNS